MHGGSTAQNAMCDRCHMGFAGIAADITKDALLPPTLNSDRLATATRPLGALRQVQKMRDCWVNISQAELVRQSTPTTMHEPVLLPQLLMDSCHSDNADGSTDSHDCLQAFDSAQTATVSLVMRTMGAPEAVMMPSASKFWGMSVA